MADGYTGFRSPVGDGVDSVQGDVGSSSTEYSKGNVRSSTVDGCGYCQYKAARRESFLSRLPPRFSAISKANLHGSVMDSAFLFEDSRVDKAIAQAENAASVSFTEAAAKSFVKPRPKPGTPLVEKHQRPSTSYASRPRSGSSQHPSTRSSLSGRSREDGPPPKRARGRPFRK